MIKKNSSLISIVFLSMLIIGCNTEKKSGSESYVLPTAGFSTTNVSTLNESGAGTTYLRVDVDLPTGFKETFLAVDGQTEDDFTMSLSVVASEASTADENDYTVGTVFFSGEFDNPYFLIPLTIVNDDTSEQTETLLLGFESSDVNPSTSLSTTINITILDDDEEKLIAFSSSNSVAKEGDSINVELSLSEAHSSPLKFPITLSGSSVLGTDYTFESPVYLSSGQEFDLEYTFDSTALELEVQVPEGVTSLRIPMKIINDGLGEDFEYVSLSISSDTSGVFSASPSASSTRISIISSFKLNDTGVNLFSNGSTIQTLNVEDPSYPNQDAKYGLILNTTLNQGFDFSYLDLSGNSSSTNSSADADAIRCVRDNTTGLTWVNLAIMPDSNANNISDTLEQSLDYTVSGVVSSQAVSGHFLAPSLLSNTASNHLYQNLKYLYNDTNTDRNGGYPGRTTFSSLYNLTDLNNATTDVAIQNLPTSEYCLPLYQDNLTSNQPTCSTESLMNYLNSISWCGKTNWRLPKFNELISVVNYSEGNNAFSPLTNVLDGSTVMTRTTAPHSKGSTMCINTFGEVKYCNKFEAATVLPVADQEE